MNRLICLIVWGTGGCGFDSGYNQVNEKLSGVPFTETVEEPTPDDEVVDEIPEEGREDLSLPEKDVDDRIVIEENVEISGELGENLLVNGSFEYPTIHTDWQLHATEEHDSSLFGWDVDFLSDTPCSVESSDNTKGLLELQRFSEDHQWAELDSHCRDGNVLDTNIKISQKVSLSKGSYALTFRYVNRKGDASLQKGLEVTFGSLKLTVNNEKDWQDYAAKLIVNADEENVELLVKEIGEGNSLGSLVDDFSISLIQ